MSRLSRYLTRLFAKEALQFFVVAALLVWITQTLRLFDLVTAKGQDILTLFGQSLLTTPPLALAIIFICMGIGLGRALNALRASRELHTIHASARTKALWQAVVVFIVIGASAAGIIAHWLEPASNRAYRQWSEEIAADLVGRALNPHRFSEVVPGLIIVIGGRDIDGTIRDFFADDTRDPDARRTYLADRAEIVFDDDGYNISLVDGAIQYIRAGDRFTEVGFSRYELSLDRCVRDGQQGQYLDETGSFELLSSAYNNAAAAPAIWVELNIRFAEMFRVVALVLIVAAIASFPSARRSRTRLPLEAIILVLGLGERVLSSIHLGLPGTIAPYAGSIVLLTAALGILAFRLFGFRLSGRGVQPA